METKSKGLKEQQRHHKKLLAAMLSQDSFDLVHSPTLSVAEEEMEDEDDAMELLGNVTWLIFNLHTPSQILNMWTRLSMSQYCAVYKHTYSYSVWDRHLFLFFYHIPEQLAVFSLAAWRVYLLKHEPSKVTNCFAHIT